MPLKRPLPASICASSARLTISSRRSDAVVTSTPANTFAVSLIPGAMRTLGLATVGDLLDRRTRVGLVAGDRAGCEPAAQRALVLAKATVR